MINFKQMYNIFMCMLLNVGEKLRLPGKVERRNTQIKKHNKINVILVKRMEIKLPRHKNKQVTTKI